MTHGLRSTYVRGCRCDQCRQANSQYARMRNRRAAYAKFDPALATLVDSTPAREHLHQLRAAGMGRREIARRSGVAQTVVSRLLGIDKSKPAARIRPTTARRLLAVTADEVAPGALVDPTGTQRRLRALVAIGWTQTDLAAAMGWTVQNLGTLIHGRYDNVTQGTSTLVRALYSELEHTPGHSKRSRNLARRNGWAPPAAWDDIDDPNDATTGTDEAPAWQRLVEDLIDTWPSHQGLFSAAAMRLGVTERTIDRALQSARASGWDVPAMRRRSA